MLLKVVEVKHLLATRKGNDYRRGCGSCRNQQKFFLINIKMTFSLSMKIEKGQTITLVLQMEDIPDCWRRF